MLHDEQKMALVACNAVHFRVCVYYNDTVATVVASCIMTHCFATHRLIKIQYPDSYSETH